MTSKNSLILLVAVLAGFLVSCGGGEIGVVKVMPQKSVSVSVGKQPKKVVGADQFAANVSSSALVKAAVSKPKDKHSMPVYSFGERQRIVRTTAYTCSEDDHIVYGSKNAIGTNLRYSDKVRSAAADWSFYPVGTVFRVKGMPQLFVVDDYGSALTGTGTIDMYMPSKAHMNAWGRRNVEISVVQWGSFKQSAEILSSRKKFSHCARMLANITRQRPDLAAVAAR